jgi:hypothetical protein
MAAADFSCGGAGVSRENFGGEMRSGTMDPYGFGPMRGDAERVLGRGRHGWVAKLNSSFSTQPG